MHNHFNKDNAELSFKSRAVSYGSCELKFLEAPYWYIYEI